jgi:holo-[acyl-carrier protein] synthase
MIIGTGIDIIEVERIRRAVERWGDGFLNHVFTPSEIEHAKRFNYPYQHYAGRFAAKEAVFKAMGMPHVSLQDLNIKNDPDGKPICYYNNSDFKHRLSISISHCKDYAVASAIVEE